MWPVAASAVRVGKCDQPAARELHSAAAFRTRYSESDERMWSLSIPMDAATNKAEYDADQEMRAKATAAKVSVCVRS